jgi:hypothetical protein
MESFAKVPGSLSRMIGLTGLASATVLLSSATVTIAAPSPLVGKSIEISFSESRMLKDPAAGTVQPASLAITIKIYVSTKGRIFDNYSSQTSSGPASGSQGGGTASTGPGAVFAARDWRFSGNSLVGQHLFERGARRMTITFDPGFTSCTLSVVNGKAKGSDTIMIISSTTGKRLEVVSSTIGATSCAIRDGNVFGAQQ